MNMGYRFLLLAAATLAATPLYAMSGKDKPAFSLKTPIERIAADSQAREILERELPGFATHPQYEQFKTMSLDALMAMFPNAVPLERAKAVDAALRALPTPGETAKDAAQAEAVPADPR